MDLLASLIKGLKTPPEDTSLWGRLLSHWWEVKWWWGDHIWSHAPRWLRHSWRSFARWWHEQITCRINPRQRWFTKQIPRTWTEKEELIELCLYAAIIHFVEGEDCFNTTTIDEPLASELRAVYDWAKTGRAAALAAQQASWHPGAWEMCGVTIGEGVERGSTEEYRRLGDEIEARDTRWLQWIVVNRAHLWT
jgi:hypothetical protein